jgi:dihydropyrimidinase
MRAKLNASAKISKLRADEILDAKDRYVIPGGVDVHTHLDMPLGARAPSMIFERQPSLLPWGAPRLIVDFAIQERGSSLSLAFETWMKKAEAKAVIDMVFTASCVSLARN